MANKTFALVADGSSDRLLRWPILWLLTQFSNQAFEPQGDWSFAAAPVRTLADRVEQTVDFTGCDLLFVHRDAETGSREERLDEIRGAMRAGWPPHVPVVPVKMTEAWLLVDQTAIRLAAGNPNGKEPLRLPPVRRIESLPDPKALLHDALRAASGLRPARRAEVNVHRLQHRVAELIDDYAPHRALQAFQEFETDLRAVLRANGWHRT